MAPEIVTEYDNKRKYVSRALNSRRGNLNSATGINIPPRGQKAWTQYHIYLLLSDIGWYSASHVSPLASNMPITEVCISSVLSPWHPGSVDRRGRCRPDQSWRRPAPKKTPLYLHRAEATATCTSIGVEVILDAILVNVLPLFGFFK